MRHSTKGCLTFFWLKGRDQIFNVDTLTVSIYFTPKLEPYVGRHWVIDTFGLRINEFFMVVHWKWTNEIGKEHNMMIPSQKLKRVFLGVIAFLIPVPIIWYISKVSWITSVIELRTNEAIIIFVATTFSIPLISTIGLYCVAKILIEIFKKEGSEQQNH